MEEVRPENEVRILTSYKRIFRPHNWHVDEEDGEYIGTHDRVSKITFTDDGVVLRYEHTSQYIPNHQMVSMTW